MKIDELPNYISRNFEPRYKFLKTLPPASRVLDCGCGDLTSTGKIMKFRSDLIWYCFDIIEPNIIPENISFKTINVENERLPYPDNYFDGVIILHMIEHISNIRLFCGEINRVLRSGGYVYIEVPSIMTLFAPTSKKFFSKTGNFFDDITHKRILTTPAMYDLVEKYFKMHVVKISSVRNIIKIIGTPLLMIYSIIKWKAYFMSGIGDIFGYRLYCVGRK